MKKTTDKRIKWLTIRLTADEYAQLENLTRKTLCRSISDYGRRILLQKPVSVRYHNQSLDVFVSDMVLLRKDLNQVGSNFNQAVHHLHTFRTVPDIQQWILINEQDKTEIFRVIESISVRINEAYKLWSLA